MSVAVVDIGTARLKGLIAAGRNGHAPRFETFSADLPRISDDGGWEAEARLAFSQAMHFIQERNVNRVIAFGTQALRSVGKDSPAFAIARDVFGQVVLLTPEAEARSFYRSVVEVLGRQEGVAVCDVGGGSVQVVWNDGPDGWGSAPIGTFALEREFQASPSKPLAPGTSGFAAMASHVQAELGSLLGARPPFRTTLVVGSNIMSDFFRSAIAATGGTCAEEVAGTRFSLEELDRLSAYVFGRDFDSLADLFPANPRFLHGADKLLLIVRSAAQLLGATSIVGTNLSVSKGLAILALESPDELKAFGF